MSKLRRTLLILAVAALLPALGRAQSATAFDGTYAGVSREVFRNNPIQPGRCFGQSGVPGPLEIKNGIVQKHGEQGWEGSVGPQGALVMHGANGSRFEGQIDSQGTISGRIAGPLCSVTFVWRKQPR